MGCREDEANDKGKEGKDADFVHGKEGMQEQQNVAATLSLLEENNGARLTLTAKGGKDNQQGISAPQPPVLLLILLLIILQMC